MDVKYNILWIDDQLAGNMKDTYEAAKEDFKELNIFGVVDMNAFKDHFYDMVWDAIIFDINNRKDINDENEDNEGSNILATLLIKDDRLEYIKENRIPIFAFSGELGPNGKNDVEEVNSQLKGYGFQAHPRTGAYFWDKSPKGELQDAIFQDIINFLNQKNQNYIGHEYLLNIFKNNWIDSQYKTDVLDPLMKIYTEKDVDALHGNNMRIFTEQILVAINEAFNLGCKEAGVSWASNIAQCIKSKELDYSEFVCGAAVHLVELSNMESHYILEPQEKSMIFDMDFNTFFYVCLWFNKIMSLKEYSKEPSENTILQNSTYNKKDKAQIPQTHGGTRPSCKVPIIDGCINLKLFGKNKKYINDSYANLTGVKISNKDGKNYYVLHLQDEEG